MQDRPREDRNEKNIRCGNGASKHKRFSSSTCTTWLVNATKQRTKGSGWKISNAEKEHVNCTGDGAAAPIASIAPMLDGYAWAKSKMMVPALKRVNRFGISERSANRAKRKIVEQIRQENKRPTPG